MASNRRTKEMVQAIQSFMEHVTLAAKMDTEQAIVGAMSVHPGTPEAKARTARTRKAKANKKDLWTMLDRRNNPKQRQDDLNWERSMRRKVESFNS